MRLHIRNPEKTARIALLITLSFMVCYGFVLVFAQVKPFWIDEWRLIYNLKFKDPATLWGPLDFTQQFPRVYLEMMKIFTRLFDYSYFTMRLPSCLVATATILLCYRLMNKIYKPDTVTRFLFVFILVSSVTFTEYFVQVKQYTMEIFLSLVAIWQLLGVLGINNNGVQHKGRYALLCLTFLVAPFFSYTYPIAAAPIFLVVLTQNILKFRSKDEPKQKPQILFLQWLPLFFAACSIVVFYLIDVSRVMADKEMNAYWSYRMMSGGSGMLHICSKCWDFFAQVGAGFIFEIIFGVLGISAFFWGAYKWVGSAGKTMYGTHELLRLYALLLIVIAIGLFMVGKLPVEPKFNAFTVPSITILVIFLLDRLYILPGYRRFTGWFIAVLIIGLIGNIVSSAADLVLKPTYAKRMEIYVATEKAIMRAQAGGIPILVTPGVAYPDAITNVVPNLATMEASAVLKTFPAYKVSDNIPVYTISDLTDLKEKVKQLPSSITSVLAGDGITFRLISR